MKVWISSQIEIIVFSDEVHALACGLLLLNSDLHNCDNSRKMTCREFVNNVAHTGYEYPKPLLKLLYQSIK